MQRLSRRRVLAASAAAVSSVAGCLGTGASGAAGDGLTLQSVEVEGSPGGSVPVRRPGEATLLDFFATWCAPCKPQMQSLGAVHDAHGDVRLLSITQETDREAIRAFWAQYDGRWPVAMDPELRAVEALGVDRIPTLIVLAPDGDEVWRHTGLASRDAIESAVGEAVA